MGTNICNNFDAIILGKKKISKGIIYQWGDSIQELQKEIKPGQGEFTLKKLKKKIIVDGQVKWVERDDILITFQSESLPTTLLLRQGRTCLTVKPYIGPVRQCYKCYQFWHSQKYCKKVRAKCRRCGDIFHDKCHRQPKCVNCGGVHMSTDRECSAYKREYEIKKMMVYEHVTYKIARQYVKIKNVKYDKLMSAIHYGNFEKVNELIYSDVISYSESYMLLRAAIQEGHENIAKLSASLRGVKINNKNGYSGTPLHFAATNGYLEITEMLLSKGANIDARDRCGSTPLLYALREGKVKIAKLLLDYGANIDISSNGTTAIHLAALSGNLEIVQLVLDCGAHIDCRCTLTNKTPLHFAIERCSVEIVQFLLSKGANVNIKAQDGETPLYIAAQQNSAEIVKLLLSKCASINDRTDSGLTPLHVSTMRRHEMVVKLLLQSGANIDAEDDSRNTALSIAVEKGYSVIVEDLLKYSPDLNSNSNKSILNTAIRGHQGTHQKIVESLLRYGVTVYPEDENKSELLRIACWRGYLKIVEDLLKYGADVDSVGKNGSAALHIAVDKCHIEMIKLLLNKGANVNVKRYDHISPLHIAAMDGNEAIVKLLLSKDANINARDKRGLLAFHCAVEKGHINIVELLLNYNVDVNSRAEIYGKKKYEVAALPIAIRNGYTSIVKILLKFGADIDIKNVDGSTPLHMACIYELRKMIMVLLENGSDINIVNNANVTPLEYLMTHYRTSSSEYNYDTDFDSDSDDSFLNDISPDNSYSRDEIAEICQQHIIKMKTANLYVSEQNLLLTGRIDRINTQEAKNNFKNKCENEMKIMKCTKIGISNVSFRDIVTDNISRLVMYAKNETIVEVLRSNNYKTMFPVYATIINNHFEKGMERKKLQEEGEQFFYSSIINLPFKLPCNCIDKILNYLSNTDLRILIDVCKSVNNTDT